MEDRFKFNFRLTYLFIYMYICTYVKSDIDLNDLLKFLKRLDPLANVVNDFLQSLNNQLFIKCEIFDKQSIKYCIFYKRYVIERMHAS